MSNSKVQNLRSHEPPANTRLCFIAVNSWSLSGRYSEADINTFQRRRDIVFAGRIVEQNQVFWSPDPEPLWTNWNMSSSISRHYFKLLWWIGDRFLLNIIFFLFCLQHLLFKGLYSQTEHTEYIINMKDWWKHTCL